MGDDKAAAPQPKHREARDLTAGRLTPPTLLIATVLTTLALALFHKVLGPWLKERAWPASERYRARALMALWKVERAQPARLQVLYFLSFAVSCALGGAVICSTAGWLLLTIAPNRPALVLRTVVQLGKAVAAASVLAMLWVIVPWPRRGASGADAGGAEPAKRKLPVTVVTGYLGAGKSTLVQRILQEQHGLKILVIENELGEEGIDNELLLQHVAKEDIVLLNNGCICCRVRRDLVSVLHALVEKMPLLDGCVIETTGIADPSPVTQSFFADEVPHTLPRSEAPGLWSSRCALRTARRRARHQRAGAQGALLPGRDPDGR